MIDEGISRAVPATESDTQIGESRHGEHLPISAESKSVERGSYWGLVGSLILGAAVFLVGYGLFTSGGSRLKKPTDEQSASSSGMEADQSGKAHLASSLDPRPGPALEPDELFARCSPAVAQVLVKGRDGRAVGSGSAFFIGKSGLLATNFHVIEKAHSAEIVFADSRIAAVAGVAAYDETADIAVLRVQPFPADLQPLLLARDELAVGSKVYAIGNPLGLANSLSDGLVSGYREFEGIRVIQTTAAISPGSSGGPLLAADGRVIGITSFRFKDGQNLNFAVPGNLVSRLLNLALTRNKSESFPLKLQSRVLALLDSGYEKYRSGRLDEALMDFDEALLLDPINAVAYGHRGMAWVGKMEFAKALDDFDVAIRLKPGDPASHDGRGIALASMRDFHGAISSFSTAIRLDPKRPGTYFNRARAFMDIGEYDKAIADYGTHLRFSTDEVVKARAYLKRGIAWDRKGNHDQAIRDYSEAILLDPSHAFAYYLRGRTRSEKGELTDAIADLNEAIRLDSRNALYRGFRGSIWYKKGNYSNAKKDFDEAERLDPKIFSQK